MTDQYESPFSVRYASPEMLKLFSQQTRAETWRKLWAKLAEIQMDLGLPIREDQVAELYAHIKDIDFAAEAACEKEVHHDVMAHIHTYGLAAPSAAGIIHLGATSCYVTDNGDLILYREALGLIRKRLLATLSALAAFADRYKALPTVGYTHYQPAQLVTVGKRACLWMQDLFSDLMELDQVTEQFHFLGCRGATGTEASLMELFSGDEGKIDELNKRLAETFGFRDCFPVSGQTYPRKLDSRILNCLSSIAQSTCKMATDIRLLQHDHELEEAFGTHQVGSSAMAYKRNPTHAERICSLSRFLISGALSGAMTAATQWFERTLDDSAGRRITLPESFLAADSILLLSEKLIQGLKVNETVIAGTVRENLPFIATEELLMEAVKKGGGRQKLHEVIRVCSMEALSSMRSGGACDLSERLAERPEFGLTKEEINALLKPEQYIGRSVVQVERFLNIIRQYCQCGTL